MFGVVDATTGKLVIFRDTLAQATHEAATMQRAWPSHRIVVVKAPERSGLSWLELVTRTERLAVLADDASRLSHANAVAGRWS